MRTPRCFVRALNRIDRKFYIKYDSKHNNFSLWRTNQPISVMGNLGVLDSKLLNHIRMINFMSTDPVGWLKKMQEENAELRSQNEQAFDDELHELYKHYRRLFARFAWNDAGSKCWESGVDIPKG